MTFRNTETEAIVVKPNPYLGYAHDVQVGQVDEESLSCPAEYLDWTSA